MSGKSRSKTLTLTFGVTGMPTVSATQLYLDLQKIVTSFQKNNGTINFTANVTKLKKSLETLNGGSPKLFEIDEKQTADLQKIKSIIEEVNNPSNIQTNWANKLEAGVSGAVQPMITFSKELTLANQKAQLLSQTFKEAPAAMQQTVVPDITKVNDGLMQMRQYYKEAAKEADELYKLQTKASAAMYATSGKDSQFSKNSAIGLNQTKELDDYYALLEQVQLAKAKLTTKQGGTLDFEQIDSTQLRQFVELTDRLSTSLKAARTASANFAKQSNANNAWDKLAARAQAYYLQIEKIVARNPQLAAEMQNLVGRIRNQDFSSVAEGQNEFLKLQQRIRDAGLETETLGQKIQRAFKEKFVYIASMGAINLLRDGLRQIYQNVVDIDSAMTELKKVTNGTNSTYNKFLDEAGERAERLGATITEVVNASADWARLGYNISDASNLADASVIASNVWDDIDGIDQASKTIISTMQGFGIEAENVMQIVDKFNAVSNVFPTSAGDIAVGMQKSAAALSVAGNTLSESIGLFTAAQSVQQDKLLSLYAATHKANPFNCWNTLRALLPQRSHEIWTSVTA